MHTSRIIILFNYNKVNTKTTKLKNKVVAKSNPKKVAISRSTSKPKKEEKVEVVEEEDIDNDNIVDVEDLEDSNSDNDDWDDDEESSEEE